MASKRGRGLSDLGGFLTSLFLAGRKVVVPVTPYSDGEALILTCVRNATNFNASNTSRGKWGILNTGKAACYAILRPGPFRQSIGTVTSIITWNTLIEVWQRYADDGTSMLDLETNVENIIAKLNTYPRAGDTVGGVIDMTVRSGNEFESMKEEGSEGPAWLRQILTVEWMEQSFITYEA
jgi:hypothetical protein